MISTFLFKWGYKVGIWAQKWGWEHCPLWGYRLETNWTALRNAVLMGPGPDFPFCFCFFFLKGWASILLGNAGSEMDLEQEWCPMGHRAAVQGAFSGSLSTQRCVWLSQLQAESSTHTQTVSGVGTYWKTHSGFEVESFIGKNDDNFNDLMWTLGIPHCLAVTALFFEPPLPISSFTYKLGCD